MSRSAGAKVSAWPSVLCCSKEKQIKTMWIKDSILRITMEYTLQTVMIESIQGSSIHEK